MPPKFWPRFLSDVKVVRNSQFRFRVWTGVIPPAISIPSFHNTPPLKIRVPYPLDGAGVLCSSKSYVCREYPVTSSVARPCHSCASTPASNSLRCSCVTSDAPSVPWIPVPPPPPTPSPLTPRNL